jgi:cell division protein FtsB
MSERRMPGGQGPARGGTRATGAPRRPSGAPARMRRAVERTREHHTTPPTSASKGGGIRRAAGPARRIRAPRRPRRISGRAATLGLLVLALAFAYAYPVRVYLGQLARIDQIEGSQAEQRQRIQELTEQLKKWDDDQYVIGQARRRLHYVREGELFYVVGTDGPAGADAPTTGPPDPWFTQLWSGVQVIDSPPVP